MNHENSGKNKVFKNTSVLTARPDVSLVRRKNFLAVKPLSVIGKWLVTHAML
jgi:hypothetical protein